MLTGKYSYTVFVLMYFLLLFYPLNAHNDDMTAPRIISIQTRTILAGVFIDKLYRTRIGFVVGINISFTAKLDYVL